MELVVDQSRFWSWLRVQRFRVRGLGFRVGQYCSSGIDAVLGIESLGFRGSGFRIEGLGV